MLRLLPILKGSDLDTKGVAFETFMDSYFKGDFGQYFTPRPLIEFIVKMLDIKRTDLILDPACGSGGFLLYAMDAIRKEGEEYYPDDGARRYEYWHAFAEHNLYGIEINDEIARVAKMNMIIHDDGHTNIIGADALDGIEKISETNRGFSKEKFDAILTNPPFGSDIKYVERPYLSDYELGLSTSKRNGKFIPLKSQDSEILFIERVHQFLKPKVGRAAIILPNGILANYTNQRVRNFLLNNFQILAIIGLPDNAFTHFGTSVRASILFLRKRGDNEISDHNEIVFMSTPELIGYDATGRLTDNQLDRVIELYKDFLINPSKYLPLKRSSADDFEVFATKQSEIIRRLDCQFYSIKYRLLIEKIMASPYKVYKLGDPYVARRIVDGPFGSDLKVEDYRDSGIPVVRVNNCREGIVDENNLVYITPEKHETISRSEVVPGDVLLTKAGSLGYTAVFPNKFSKGNITSHLALIRPSRNVLSQYLAAYLQGDFGLMQLYR